MKSQSTKNMSHKQRGVATMDMVIFATLAIGILLFIVMKVPDIRNSMRISEFQSDASTVSDAVFRWKKGRSNYTGVTLTKLCSQNILTKAGRICGKSNNGVATNQFGGNWVVAANKNPGLYDVSATLPNNPETIAELADAMAPTTRGGCQEATGCATLVASGTTLKMTY